MAALNGAPSDNQRDPDACADSDEQKPVCAAPAAKAVFSDCGSVCIIDHPGRAGETARENFGNRLSVQRRNIAVRACCEVRQDMTREADADAAELGDMRIAHQGLNGGAVGIKYLMRVIFDRDRNAVTRQNGPSV